MRPLVFRPTAAWVVVLGEFLIGFSRFYRGFLFFLASCFFQKCILGLIVCLLVFSRFDSVLFSALDCVFWRV